MTATSHLNGHPIAFTAEAWRYADTGEPVEAGRPRGMARGRGRPMRRLIALLRLISSLWPGRGVECSP